MSTVLLVLLIQLGLGRRFMGWIIIYEPKLSRPVCIPCIVLIIKRRENPFGSSLISKTSSAMRDMDIQLYTFDYVCY